MISVQVSHPSPRRHHHYASATGSVTSGQTRGDEGWGCDRVVSEPQRFPYLRLDDTPSSSAGSDSGPSKASSAASQATPAGPHTPSDPRPVTPPPPSPVLPPAAPILPSPPHSPLAHISAERRQDSSPRREETVTVAYEEFGINDYVKNDERGRKPCAKRSSYAPGIAKRSLNQILEEKHVGRSSQESYIQVLIAVLTAEIRQNRLNSIMELKVLILELYLVNSCVAEQKTLIVLLVDTPFAGRIASPLV
ncbi:hypothetical protein E3N88_04161 [Mikania micrantha]|uniref:Uncharacterized protein n=1 Tax=Mikania micrantha TaxID=192012 RepID=A0A5N6PUK2_9ASTR|nr:hypothetical protein E3N88_04161 [Mikania micrantha]